MDPPSKECREGNRSPGPVTMPHQQSNAEPDVRGKPERGDGNNGTYNRLRCSFSHCGTRNGNGGFVLCGKADFVCGQLLIPPWLPFAGTARPDAIQNTDADSVVNPGRPYQMETGEFSSTTRHWLRQCRSERALDARVRRPGSSCCTCSASGTPNEWRIGSFSTPPCHWLCQCGSKGARDVRERRPGVRCARAEVKRSARRLSSEREIKLVVPRLSCFVPGI